MRSKLEVGDEIVTIGGIISTGWSISKMRPSSSRPAATAARSASPVGLSNRTTAQNRLCRRIKRDPFEYPVTGIKEGLG